MTEVVEIFYIFIMMNRAKSAKHDQEPLHKYFESKICSIHTLLSAQLHNLNIFLNWDMENTMQKVKCNN